MLPLLPFAAGLVTGAVAIKLWRQDKTRHTLDKARSSLRDATVNGLARLEHSSAAIRERLTGESEAEALPAQAANDATEPAPTIIPATSPAKRPPRRRKASPPAGDTDGASA